MSKFKPSRGRPRLGVAALVSLCATSFMLLLGAAGSYALPADRAYELVTPAEKPGEYWTGFAGSHFATTADGSHVFFYSALPILFEGEEYPTDYWSDRGEGGWTTVAVNPAVHAIPDDFRPYAFWEKDGSVVVATVDSLDPADGDTSVDWYHLKRDGSRELMTPTEVPGSIETQKTMVGSAPEGGGIVFSNVHDALLPEEIGHQDGFTQLYEYRNGLRAVALDNTGKRLTEGNETLGSSQLYGIQFNAYSRDGRRIYFTAEDSGTPGDRVGLYVRTDGVRTDPIPAQPEGTNASSVYLGATPDGRKAFFATELQLTADDHDSSMDLYEYDAETKTVKRLSVGPVPAEVEVYSPVWSSEDGSRVYFTAHGQLVPGHGSEKGNKTFLYDHGLLKFVADTQLILPTFAAGSNGPQCSPTRMTADGRFLLAETRAALTPDDTDGGALDVYRYDAQTGGIVRVSTGPLDSNSPEDASINNQPRIEGFVGCDAQFQNVTRPMSENGRYVFFETTQALVPQDTNAAYDVYVWDALTGATSLISGGTGNYRADLLDATPDGKMVFFSTDAGLLPSDRDGAVDIYAARVGGGFPEAPPPPPACRESECQGEQGVPPAFGSPGSRLFSGSRSAGASPARLRIGGVTGSALRRLLRTGVLTVHVVPGVSGRVSVAVWIPARGLEKKAGVGIAVGVAGRAQTLNVRLSRAGRRLFARYRRLRLVAHQNGLPDVSVRARLARRGSGR